MSFGSIGGMFTAVVTTPPVSAAATCSATCSPARSCASTVDAPRCGVTTTLGLPNSGWSVIGSDLKTSSAAPATLPDSMASASATSSSSCPRAQLTIRTPSFICAKASRESMPCVSGVAATCKVR